MSLQACGEAYHKRGRNRKIARNAWRPIERKAKPDNMVPRVCMAASSKETISARSRIFQFMSISAGSSIATTACSAAFNLSISSLNKQEIIAAAEKGIVVVISNIRYVWVET